MQIADSTVLVTGANRGLGKALVEEALRRDAKRVYAGARQSLAHGDKRVTPLTLDVTNTAQMLVSESIGSGTPTGKRTAETYPGDSARTPMARGIAERKARECRSAAEERLPNLRQSC
jgi:hypothetical protein